MKIFSLQASTCKSMAMMTSEGPAKRTLARHILLNGAHAAPLQRAG